MGYELVVVANPKSPFADAIKELDCELILASHFLLKHSRSITQGCQAIHVHEGKAVYWALIQHLLSGCPYIITRRVDNPLKDKWLLKLAYQKAKYVVGLSSAITSEIIKRLPDLDAKVIPSSPVFYPRIEENVVAIRKRYEGKFIVIQAAKLYEHKGQDVAIEAARLIEQEFPQVQFCLLGDGPQEARLKALAKELSNVDFLGKQSNMGDWFAAANLLIHPSYSEGLGSVILEASSAGLPVIGTKAGGIPDIIEHELNGLLVEPGKPDQLAEAIIRVLKYQDLRGNMIANAPKKLEKFDIEKTAIQYQELYQ